MDSIAARADAVREAVASVSTCTPITSASLKELLQTNDINHDAAKHVSKSRTNRATRPPSRTIPSLEAQRIRNEGGSWTAKEKALLATQVINASLKALGEAAKSSSTPSSDARELPKNEPAKPAPRAALRRSMSSPAEPLQPRSLNRVSTCPTVPKAPRPSSSSGASSTGCLATIECARTAFSALCSIQASRSLSLPEFQLENGMSLFVNRLIGLNHFEQAARELRILKGRLERMNQDQGGKLVAPRARAESNTVLRKVSELLDFPKITASGPLLGLIISTQLQALRIILGLKKPSHLEGLLPLLRESCPSSPMNLLLMSLKDEHPDQTKCAKQLENLSQILFSLPPSIAPKDDDFAVEPMLSPSPEVALEIQALGFAIRLQSWSVSGHRGDVDKDILFPFSKCLAAFARRSPSGKFAVAFSSFSLVWKRVEKLGLRPKESLQSPLATIYQVLATTSRESGNVNEAKKWLGKLKFMANPSEDSAARCCSIAAQLLALSLKQSSQFDENLLKEVMDGIKGSFSGRSVEVDELLASVCLLRKSVMNLVTERHENAAPISSATRELFETFIFQLPRFAVRWLGKPPGSTNGTKECLRFEQRRGLLSTYLPHMLDSALMVAKLLLDDDRLAWDIMDSTLQDSLSVLENIGDLTRSGIKANPSASYYVKISHFYYQQHLVLRKAGSKATEVTSLKALRKSIECVKNRSEAEQTRSQLLVKWEKFAELCRATGRLEDALDALRSIRDHLVRQGLVSTITTSLATEPWWAAWQQNPDVELLSRTVCNLARLDRKHNDWTWLLDGSNKATALEHDLYAIISKDHKYRYESDLSSPTIKALLEIYTIERHPIRRLRTLLQLLAINMDARDGLASLRTEAEAALDGITEDTLASDAGLARYIPHLRALSACMFGLVDSDISSSKIKAALSGWKHMVSKCQSAEQLSAYIDSPPQLLTNLRSLADFARIKGFESLHTEILELSMNLSRLTADCNPELLVTQSIALCLQHLSHGWSSKAKKLLVDNQDLISRPEITKDLAVNFHLSAAEYHLSLGVLDKAEQHLCDARDAEVALVGEPGARKGKGANRRVATAYAYFLFSTLALERGDCYHALRFAKTAVRKVFLDWSKLDEMRCAAEDTSMDDLSQSDTSEKDTSLHGSCMGKPDFSRPSTGPEFWALAYPLFRFLSQLSSTYAHVGMYQETLYYAEQAQKVARSMESATCVSQSLAWLAWVWLMAGKPEKATELAAETKPIALTLEPTYQNAKMLCQLSSVCGEINDTEAQVELLSKAESMLKVLNGEVQSTGNSLPHDLEFGMAELSIKEKPTVKVAVRRTAAVKTTRATNKSAPKKAAPKRINPPIETTVQIQPEETHLSFLRALILQNQSTRLISEHDWTAAVTTLRTAYELSKLPADVSQACFLMGVALIGQSLEQMGQDAVFSVIQDSTLSFPSVTGSFKERLSLTKTTAPRNRRGVAKSTQNTKSFFDKLREAQGHLLAAHSIASLNGDGALIHRIATVLQNVVILLANTNMSKPAASHPSHATSSVELARNLIWRREGKALHLEATKEKSDWPTFTKNPETRRTSLGLTLDMDCFQRDFVDIIPTSWNVLSVSLSDNENDLCITKLQAGHGPFGIRLPLERAGSKEVDNEVFSFQQGRAELLEIIQVANRTCHDARDMSQKGAKSKWWAEREELDERLKNLMDSIEQTWLGGFKGIFSQHPRRADLLTKFQRSFQGILDKHLPSRNVRGRRGKAAAPTTKVSLDPRIYDLFIGLGDPAAQDEGVDEPLTDLLYFVVDILQFHGETNAYDEVDFDAMVVETYGALHSYHVGAKGIKEADDGGVHTILILDNSLHAFPWESLPCLQGLAVSRVPSLACLRRLIQEMKPAEGVIVDKDNDELSGSPDAQWDNQRDGHYVSIHSGTYILNPGSDLKNTQATFGPALSSLPPTWNSIEMREPSEPEFEKALAERDLLLYFGHGSGAQYVRGRTVRKMDKCRAVALLMGCSSASLADVGRFECHGPVWNYMLAGSPAVVGTLWDVTDRDIDRFAGRVFEEWGLLPRGTFAEDSTSSSSSSSKGKKVARGDNGGSSRGGDRKKATKMEAGGDAAGAGGQTSLVEAVAKARDACRFRYLTAAAVCVYGIPAYINHQ